MDQTSITSDSRSKIPTLFKNKLLTSVAANSAKATITNNKILSRNPQNNAQSQNCKNNQVARKTSLMSKRTDSSENDKLNNDETSTFDEGMMQQLVSNKRSNETLRMRSKLYK